MLQCCCDHIWLIYFSWFDKAGFVYLQQVICKQSSHFTNVFSAHNCLMSSIHKQRPVLRLFVSNFLFSGFPLGYWPFWPHHFVSALCNNSSDLKRKCHLWSNDREKRVCFCICQIFCITLYFSDPSDNRHRSGCSTLASNEGYPPKGYPPNPQYSTEIAGS